VADVSGLDIFAWIVLIILVASVVAAFCITGWLPGHIAKTRAQAVTVAGWVTLAAASRCGRARADLGLCQSASVACEGAAAMITIMAVYLAQ
jgi:hypothetical protein